MRSAGPCAIPQSPPFGASGQRQAAPIVRLAVPGFGAIVTASPFPGQRRWRTGATGIGDQRAFSDGVDMDDDRQFIRAYQRRSNAGEIPLVRLSRRWGYSSSPSPSPLVTAHSGR